MDNCRLIQVVTPIAVAISDLILSLVQINTSPGTWYTAIVVENYFSAILANKVYQNQCIFS